MCPQWMNRIERHLIFSVASQRTRGFSGTTGTRTRQSGRQTRKDDRDRMAYHFEYVTLLLQGAIDAQARVVRQIYEISLPPSKASFRNTDFTNRLRAKGGFTLRSG